MTADPRPHRRAFLHTATAALGSALCPHRAGRTADPPAADDSVDLPITEARSFDAALPGIWHIPDRTKPLRKLVDRESLLPVGKRSLVLMETATTVKLEEKSPQFNVAVGIPSDVGNEQTLLGCLFSVQTAKGTDIPFKVRFCQGKGHGCRVAHLAMEESPGGVPIVLSFKYLMLLPPPLSNVQIEMARRQLLKRNAKPRKWDDTPGFPRPAFREGGPAFVGVRPSAAYFQTINDVLKATDTVVDYDPAPQFLTLDPDKAKANKRGHDGARARVAEKALVGVARAATVQLFDATAGLTHAVLLIEDPETGRYFMGDVSKGQPTMCPHYGSCFFLGPMKNEGIPNPNDMPHDFTEPIVMNVSATATITQLRELLVVGSSQPGHKDGAKCQAWLKNIPEVFRELEKKLLK